MSHFSNNIDEVTHKAAIKGKQVAYRNIYDRFKSPVYNLAYRMLQNREDALDVMQNSFVSAFRNLKQWSGQVAFGYWLRKIVINQALQQQRKNSQLTAADLDTDDLPDDLSEQALELSHDLNVMLAQLPPLSRSVLWLFEVEGLSHKEIADLYQMSVSFSKSQLSRSKKLMANWLSDQEQKNEQQHSH